MPRLVIALLLILAPFAESADIMVGATNVAVRKQTNAAPSDAFVRRRLELVPAFAAPRLLAAGFPAETPMVMVGAMTFSDGHLWLSARPRAETNLPPGAGRLWTFTPDSNRLEPIRGALRGNAVNALHPGTGRLWLAADGGIGGFDTQTFTTEPYGATRGVTATNIVGFAEADASLLALGDSGVVFSLPPAAQNFARFGPPALALAPGAAESWRGFAASRDWLLAATDSTVVTRHLRAPQWQALHGELVLNSPRLDSPRVLCAAGDGDGGFWLGSDAGLHWVNPDNGAVENRFAPLGITVPGGLGFTLAPGLQPTAAAYRSARERVMNGVRDRMRQRARIARARADARIALSPVVPTSRLPGGVTALFADKSYLWVATTDGLNTARARVLLLHMPSRKWVGWFAVGAPVRCFAANDRFLWLGLDVTPSPALSPLLAVDKQPLFAVPPARWTPDALRPGELAAKLAALPAKERAVHAFFGGDAAQVVELLAPDGRPRDGTDAEALFLLAFAHDPIGLDRPTELERYLAELRTRFPDSLFTEIANGVRPAPKAAPTEAAPAVVAPETVAEVLARRDLSGDGRLNPVEFKLWRGPDADFGTYDLNHDGQLDAAELEAVLKAPPPLPPK